MDIDYINTIMQIINDPKAIYDFDNLRNRKQEFNIQ